MSNTDMLSIATAYTRRGLSVIPVPHMQKAPSCPNWSKMRLTVDDLPRHFSNKPSNIGILVGEPSNFIVDVDLDCREALAASRYFLPPTDCVHGRNQNPSSHYWYHLIGSHPKTTRFQDEHSTLVEIRSTGGHTLVPPSVHPTGDQLFWNREGTPSDVQANELITAVRLVASAALIARHWPRGSRHQVALALAGALLLRSWDVDKVCNFLAAVCEAAVDEESKDRQQAVTDTARRIQAHEATTGLTRLSEIVGPKVVARIVEWLELPCEAWIDSNNDDPDIRHSDGLTPIAVGDGHLRHITTKTLDVLHATNDPPTVFRYGGTLAKIEHDENDRPQIVMLDEAGLRCILARRINYVSTSKKRGTIAVAPPMQVMSDILNLGSWPQIPPLAGIVTSPVVGRNGILQTTPGYHYDSRLYYDAEHDFQIDLVNASAENIERAWQILGDLLADFPFLDAASRAHTISLLLLPFVRPLIEGPTPLYLIDAPTPGTGKSLLAELLVGVFVHQGATIMTEGNSEDEWRKRITSTLIKTPSHILIDNVKRKLSSGVLCGVLTSAIWEDRILGLSKNAVLPVRCAWIVTGNNVQLDGEIVRRTALIRLDSGMERPAERDGFRIPDIRAWVVRNRPLLVWACLTLVSAWLDAGQPTFTGAAFGSYEHWTQVMGGILQALGVEGFLENREALYEQSDPERDLWQAFLEEWFARHNSSKVGVAHVMEIAVGKSSLEFGLLSDILGHGDQKSQRTRLGTLLRANRDRIFGSLQLKGAGKLQGAAQYMVVQVDRSSGQPAESPR